MSLLSYFFHSTPKEKDADLVLYAPISGPIIPLSEVPDVVISEKIVGDGVAFMPEFDTNILAPCDGTISRLLPASNAFAIRTEHNIEVYVTFGIGALDLHGEGLTSLVKAGDKVGKGDPVLYIALSQIGSRLKSAVTSVIVVRTSGNIANITVASGMAVSAVTPCVWVSLGL